MTQDPNAQSPPPQPLTPGERIKRRRVKLEVPLDRVRSNKALREAGVTVERWAQIEAGAGFTKGEAAVMARFFGMRLQEFSDFVHGVADRPFFVNDATHEFSMFTSVGQAIEYHRRTRGWSQKQLGEATRMPQTRISQLEKGDSRPAFETILRFAGAFKLQWPKLVPRHLAGLYRDRERNFNLDRRAERPDLPNPALDPSDEDLLDELKDVL